MLLVPSSKCRSFLSCTLRNVAPVLTGCGKGYSSWVVAQAQEYKVGIFPQSFDEDVDFICGLYSRKKMKVMAGKPSTRPNIYSPRDDDCPSVFGFFLDILELCRDIQWLQK